MKNSQSSEKTYRFRRIYEKVQIQTKHAVRKTRRAADRGVSGRKIPRTELYKVLKGNGAAGMEHFNNVFKRKDGTSIVLPEIGDQEEAKLIKESPKEYSQRLDRMNQSSLKHIGQSPAAFIAELDKSQRGEDKTSDEMHFGMATHMACFEPQLFRERFVVQPDFGAMQSSKNRAARDEWKSKQHKDSVILTEQEMETLTEMLPKVQTFFEVYENAQPEVTLIGTDRDTGIKKRARVDLVGNVKNGGPVVVDLKTTRTVDKHLFMNEIIKRQVHLQLAYYSDLLSEVVGKSVDCHLIACEKQAPFTCVGFAVPDDLIEQGRMEYKNLLSIYATCMRVGRWPDNGGRFIDLPVPAWVYNRELPSFDFGG